MKPLRRETILYVLAFVLALAVRLVKLGAAPLNDFEAGWALQALGVAQGTHPALGSQSAYILLTAVSFFFYGGGTNFLARLMPALTGSALALVPLLFRERLKPRPSLILAFFLALDPGLVALSRQAGSAIMALTFLLCAWGFWGGRRANWAGIFAGLALLSGPSLWAGCLGLALTWVIRRGLEGDSKAESGTRPARGEWLSAVWFGLGTLLLGGTLFFLSPSGLSAWTSALPEYVQGWVRPSGVSGGMMLFSLLAYQPLALVLGLIAMVRGWMNRSRRVVRLSLWMLVALLLALFYPAHQVSDLVWMLMPLWSLAALELARNLRAQPEERREVLGVAGLSLLILIFSWLDFLGLIRSGPDQATLRTWLLFGSLFLWVVSLLLVAVGWSIRSAWFGAVWGLVAALGIYSIGTMTGAAGWRAGATEEMWNPGPMLPQADLLLGTVNQVSDLSDAEINAQPVAILGIDSPALAWLLRGHTVNVVTVLDPSTLPPIVIAPQQESSNATLTAAYRGESFIWRQATSWGAALPSDWMSWIAFHQMPQDAETVILWVRQDLFLDSTSPKP